MSHQLPDELPPRPRSAFAAAVDEGKRGKDGRKLGGATNPRFTQEYWTDERREEQSKKIKRLMAEGKVGGQNGFHRRKTKKMQEIVAEKAQREADTIVAKLMAMVMQDKDKRLQLEAIDRLARFEDWSVKNSREDEKEYRAMTKDQLEARLLETLGEAMGLDLTDLIVDGEVVDEEIVSAIGELGAGEDDDE